MRGLKKWLGKGEKPLARQSAETKLKRHAGTRAATAHLTSKAEEKTGWHRVGLCDRSKLDHISRISPTAGDSPRPTDSRHHVRSGAQRHLSPPLQPLARLLGARVPPPHQAALAVCLPTRAPTQLTTTLESATDARSEANRRPRRRRSCRRTTRPATCAPATRARAAPPTRRTRPPLSSSTTTAPSGSRRPSTIPARTPPPPLTTMGTTPRRSCCAWSR